MVQNIDYAPTFLELAGVDIPEDIQGVSLLPLLKGERPKDWRKSLYYHFYEYPAEHAVKRHYGVRTERYKLIHFYNDIDAWELYDLKKDPREMHNLFGKPGYEKITEKLKGVWRSAGKSDNFHVTLMRLPYDNAEDFKPFNSEGAWRATIIDGGDDFITKQFL